MADPIVINAKTDEEMRAEIAQRALCSMHNLMVALKNQQELADDSNDEEQSNALRELWKTLWPRIHELNTAALRSFEPREDLRELAGLVGASHG